MRRDSIKFSHGACPGPRYGFSRIVQSGKFFIARTLRKCAVLRMRSRAMTSTCFNLERAKHQIIGDHILSKLQVTASNRDCRKSDMWNDCNKTFTLLLICLCIPGAEGACCWLCAQGPKRSLRPMGTKRRGLLRHCPIQDFHLWRLLSGSSVSSVSYVLRLRRAPYSQNVHLVRMRFGSSPKGQNSEESGIHLCCPRGRHH